ncbi:hypothetical protein N7492_005941 [Penicillium capsulatum]|uniref:BTB domain-containing protein n=1 Tax=Penicillium capsulatum TaxID=69766 RepID=A0A9W9LSM1_9EURO|nr:hypothetical protein N7492_005941 [Penicillium capsulatum]KAJ6134956.1 hypothetical protein N7512_000116 [Penicillium capsulatum]
MISSLFLNEQYSDLQIICEGEVFPAHKNIVCPRSGYFQRACRNFKVFPLSPRSHPINRRNADPKKEASEPVRFKDKDPVLIRKVLEYLYTGTYAPETCEGFPAIEPAPVMSSDSTATSQNSMDLVLDVDNLRDAYFHARLHGEAEYFMIDDLEANTKERFCGSLQASIGWKYLFTEDYDKKEPSDMILDSFETIVREIYSQRANYRALRPSLIQHVLENLPTFRGATFHVLSDELLQEVPGLTFDICQFLLNQDTKKPLAAQVFNQNDYRSTTTRRFLQ